MERSIYKDKLFIIWELKQELSLCNEPLGSSIMVWSLLESWEKLGIKNRI